MDGQIAGSFSRVQHNKRKKGERKIFIAHNSRTLFAVHPFFVNV